MTNSVDSSSRSGEMRQDVTLPLPGEASQSDMQVLAGMAAQDDAYVQGRDEQLEEDIELLAWAYGKLHHINFTKLDDALMLDRIKLLMEHGVVA